MNQNTIEDFVQARAIEVADQICVELGIVPEFAKEAVDYCKHDIPCIAAFLYMIYLGMSKDKIIEQKNLHKKIEECIQFLRDEENRLNDLLLFKKESRLDYIINIIEKQKLSISIFPPNTNSPSALKSRR